jgi:hypothetical protein
MYRKYKFRGMCTLKAFLYRKLNQLSELHGLPYRVKYVAQHYTLSQTGRQRPVWEEKNDII